MPATEKDLFAMLDSLGITTVTHRHPPLFTVEESKRLRGALPGGHCKNLFLRDHRKVNWLVVALEDRDVNMKSLAAAIGSGRLSFGSAERLMEYLGVEPGAVTPFALINDREGRVKVVLDAEMLQRSPLNYHPLTNTATTAIAPADFMRFLQATGHEPLVVRL